jgi:HCOMODA/2-hydroxy-3-carboxy-muconic semialdehyde decarboxylase
VSAPARATSVSAVAVAEVARILARAGLVEAFGHVSARRSTGGFLITSTDPLGAAHPGDVCRLDADESLHGGTGDGVPLEAPLHAAIYKARPDVSAICRTHSRWAIAWGARVQVPPLVHGLGALAGSVAVWEDIQLVTDSERAERVAAELGEHDCLLLRGNGALATAQSLESAAVRAWFLEERCRSAADSWDQAVTIAASELAERAGWFPAEEARAWRWLRWRFGSEPKPGT